MAGRAIIVANGDINNYEFYSKIFSEKYNFLICADGAAAHMRKFNIMPDLLVGDFDSISEENLEFYRTCGIEIVRFPVEKDMTDTELAIDIAAERGCDEITIIGGLGARVDHSLSNIFLLVKILRKRLKGLLVNETNEIRVIDDTIVVSKKEGSKVTLLSLTDKVTGVNTKGLYYPLKDATLVMGSSYGVSNEFVSDIAEISIESGLLLVILSRD